MPRKPRKRYKVKIANITKGDYTWAPSEAKALGNVLARYVKNVGDAMTELREEKRAGNVLFAVEHDPVLLVVSKKNGKQRQSLLWADKKTKIKCRVKGCKKLIPTSNKTGLCRKHWLNRKQLKTSGFGG